MSAAIAIPLIALSSPAATPTAATGAVVIALCGLFTSGWVCCIFTVAFGSGGLLPSGGKVIRAVSFFGDAAFWVIGSVDPPAAGAGLSGTVGRAPSDGGLGGRLPPPNGFTGGIPGAEGGGLGAGGGGTNGFPPAEGGGGGGALPSLDDAMGSL